MKKCNEDVNNAKTSYLPGMRVKLVKLDSFNAPPIGTEGTVRGVDDNGAVIVTWDNGSWLNVVPDKDEIEIISESEVYTLYSQEGDITFIMEDKDNTTSVVGFYYGEPDEEATKLYRGKLSAHFE
jgi:hypothetical protein